MPAARCCSSRSGSLVLVLAALLMAGCAGKPEQLLSPVAAASAPVQVAAATAPPAVQKVEVESAEALAVPRESAWCRYLDARANAKNALLYSPTVSASIDDRQTANAKISYDVVDLARANLEKKSADASCARHYAADRITRMLYMTPQSLTYAGNLERANYLATMGPELAAISRRIRNHVSNGEMTAQLASGLTQYIETVRSLEYQARAEAHRREAVKFFSEGSMTGLDRQLIDAERALQEVDRRSRSLEALSVNVSAGVGRDGENEENLFTKESAYAKVTVSYRLGAISPARSNYERLAEEARLEALHEEGQGSLWYSREMAEAINRAREGLLVQKRNVVAAIAEAQSNSKKLTPGYEIELYQSIYRAKVDVIKLTSDLRGIEGTLADIDKVERSLRFE